MPRVIRTERILGWKGRVYQGLAYRIESPGSAKRDDKSLNYPVWGSCSSIFALNAVRGVSKHLCKAMYNIRICGKRMMLGDLSSEGCDQPQRAL